VKKSASTICILLLMGTFCSIAGCSGPSAGSQPDVPPASVNIGFSTENQTPGAAEYTSDMDTDSLYTISYPYDPMPETFDELQSVNTTRDKQSQDIHILYVSGNRLDATGKAARWTYAVRHLNRTFLVTFDNTGMKITDWNTSLPTDEISFDQVISPSDLFLRNRDAIFASADAEITEKRDIMLGNGMYSLTITSPVKPRTLVFDAMTGVLK